MILLTNVNDFMKVGMKLLKHINVGNWQYRTGDRVEPTGLYFVNVVCTWYE